VFKNIKYNLTNHLLVGYSQFSEKLDRDTLIEQSLTLIQQSVNTHMYSNKTIGCQA